MASTLTFSLLTPARQVAELAATYVAVPGEEGDFGVLPGHMPLVSTIRAEGTVTVTDQAGETHSYKISGGFADVRADKVTVLAEALLA
jgi:F-type H+-transporting ATPase subunit epsilon